MIKTEQLTKKFGDDRGVFDINLDVPEGVIYGFIGHNGAGKTTAIKLLCGLLKPDSGKAFVADIEVLPRNLSQIKRKIGYMPDITGIYEQMSVWEFLDFYGAAFKIHPKKRKERIETVLDLTHALDMIDFQMISLSRGMRQRIGLAKTLIHDPDVIILDEPAGGLDPNARIEMRQTIGRLSKLGKTILLSSHILPELSSVCDKIGVISRGRLLAQGTVREISSLLQENIVIDMTIDSDMQYAKTVLTEIEGIDSVRQIDNSQYQVVFNGNREDVGSLLQELLKRKIDVRWFAENEANLEDVFMDLTRNGSQ